MPETTNGTLPSSAVIFDVVCLIIEINFFDIQLLMGKEISKTFPDRRGSVKWEEM